MIRTIIVAPSTLCIYSPNTTKQTYELLQRINQSWFQRGTHITLDLSKVEYITAAASVLLFATINTCQLMSGNPNTVKCIFPKADRNPVGHRYIVKTGLSKALLAGSFEKIQALQESQNYYQTGVDPLKLLIVTLEIFNKNLPSEQIDILISGIGEAMLNVIHHAYKKAGSETEIDPVKLDIVESVGERWWQCAWYDESENSWTFIICDIGLGVAQTYLREMSIVGSQLPMETALQEALTGGNSRFIGSGRGNGSEDIKRPVDARAKEELLIYSSGYKYQYNSNTPQGQVLPIGLFFHGTLVQWTLCADCLGG